MIRPTTAHYYTPSGRSIQKPYVKGDTGSYGNDIMDRYKHGEFSSADSIRLDESLKYTTPKAVRYMAAVESCPMYCANRHHRRQ